MERLLLWATPGYRGFPARGRGQIPGLHASQVELASNSSMDWRVNPGMTAAQRLAIQKQEEAIRRAIELKQMLNALEKVDDETRRTSLLDTLCSKEDILNLPLHPDPPGIKSGNLKVDLLKHQVPHYAISPSALKYDLPYRIRLCNGASNANIPRCQLRRLTTRFSFGR